MLVLMLFVQVFAQLSGDKTEAKDVEAMLLQARPLPLNRVRFLGDPLKLAQDLDAKYLLELEPDRMMAYYRENAGLKPKAEPYGGWDGGGRNLTGHIAGHHLSAVSLMWAATGDVRFKERADYLVKELKVVQDKHGDGYLSALAGGRACFDALAGGEIRSAGVDLNGEWSPWYTLHKTYGGLRDAYRYTGNRTARFFDVEYAIPASLVRSKEKVTVRFEAVEGNQIAGVFGVRMIRGNNELRNQYEESMKKFE